jgi:hypothetical protein
LKRSLVLVLCGLLLAGGGIAVGRYVVPSAHVAVSSPPTSALPSNSIPSLTTTTTVPAGVGGAVDLSDSAGDGLSVTLQQVIDPDPVDGSTELPTCPSSGQRIVAIQLVLQNDGSNVLTSSGVSPGVTLVDANATPYSGTDDGPGRGFGSEDCDLGTSTDVTPACASSSYSIDLAPRDSATVCPVIEVPANDSIAEVQFAPSKVFTESGFDTEAVWHLNG